MFHFVFAYAGCNVVVSHSAVVGDEHIGATGCDSEEAKHEFGVLVHTAGCNGNQANALLGACGHRLLKRVDDVGFVVSGRITAKLMVQVAEERHKKAILSDLLSDGGSSIYMKPITRYVHVSDPVDFYTLGASAARYGEIAIGYKRFNDDGSFEIVVNPTSKAPTQFGRGDDLFRLA